MKSSAKAAAVEIPKDGHIPVVKKEEDASSESSSSSSSVSTDSSSSDSEGAITFS